jgi:hypothetical protein
MRKRTSEIFFIFFLTYKNKDFSKKKNSLILSLARSSNIDILYSRFIEREWLYRICTRYTKVVAGYEDRGIVFT